MGLYDPLAQKANPPLARDQEQKGPAGQASVGIGGLTKEGHYRGCAQTQLGTGHRGGLCWTSTLRRKDRITIPRFQKASFQTATTPGRPLLTDKAPMGLNTRFLWDCW